MLPINSQNPFHLVQKCNTQPAPVAGSNARPSTVRSESTYQRGSGMKVVACTRVTRQLAAFEASPSRSPAAEPRRLWRCGRRHWQGWSWGVFIRGDAWEALTRRSPTPCLAPIYVFRIQLVWGLKSSPTSIEKRVLQGEAMHAVCTCTGCGHPENLLSALFSAWGTGSMLTETLLC